jgi:membrane-associated protein
MLDFIRSLTHPEGLVYLLSTLFGGWRGYAMLFAVVFSETGLLVGFFLPGDSLLFTVGVLAGAGELDIVIVNVLLMLAAIVGDSVGYRLGRSAGMRVFHRPDSWLFKREYLLRTKAFYEMYGAKTIIYARFIPSVRTFAPFVAGVAEMNYGRFIIFNVCGGIGWVFGLTMLGYMLGNVPLVNQNFEKVILFIMVVSLLPAVGEYLKRRRSAHKAPKPSPTEAGVDQ